MTDKVWIKMLLMLPLTGCLLEPAPAGVQTATQNVEAEPEAPPPIFAYSDATVLPPNPLLQPLLVAQKPVVCSTHAPRQVLTLDQALDHGWRYLEDRIGASNLATFRATAALDSAPAAQVFAMAAMATHRPDGALAGFLRAHELDPESKIALINAAGMLAGQDMPNEALALLDAAAAMPGPVETPMGIPGEQLAANTRGYALLLLGEWADAEAILRPLDEAGSQLSEARLNLSRALLCQNKDDEAVRFYRLGSRRQLFDEDRHPDRDQEIEGTHLPMARSLDLSAGKQFTLPPLGVMNTPAQAQSVYDHTVALTDEWIARGNTREALLAANVAARDARGIPSPLSFARLSNVVFAAAHAEYEPDIQAALQAYLDQEDRMTELESQQDAEWDDLWLGVHTNDEYLAALGTCPGMITSHLNTWLPEYFAFENLLQTYATAKYAAKTGAAANLADQLDHEYVMLSVEDNIDLDVAWRLSILGSYAFRIAELWQVCQSAAEPMPATDSRPDFAWPQRCPDALTRGKVELTILDMVQVRANCETIEVEAFAPEVLSLFGQVTVDLEHKTTTLFAGAKLNAPATVGSLGVNEGLYLSFGDDGGIKDLGMKWSTSADTTGPLAISADGPGIELGVADAVEYLMGPPAP